MPYYCAVKGCGNKVRITKNNPDIVYHTFPRDGDRLHKWILFCGQSKDWKPQKNQATADVSEILSDPLASPVESELQLQQAQSLDSESENLLLDTVFVPEPVALEENVPSVVTEVVEPETPATVASDAPAAFQLSEAHPDFQAPYQYETPKIELDYLAPPAPTETPTVEYLPPVPVAQTVAKRHARLRVLV
ncbi:uncharacterized protein LOC129764968 [Toxorhynchites rutilus septentrionalis]|uniref:uncharacterized protein LOC129764968 n=1 Tax=Toxorhynchites rutilus septentrionalis TaxID=329112 RepID=UPI0024784A04|nr:uncharacterized protein LOC129764968 [Toxorhynchites rutilus septentrionalis]